MKPETSRKRYLNVKTVANEATLPRNIVKKQANL